MIMGLGGKARLGEGDAACALREVSAEAGLVIDPDSLTWRAELSFVGALPLEQMWDDEGYWLPRVLAGETLAGTITYDEACKLVTRAELKAASGPLAG